MNRRAPMQMQGGATFLCNRHGIGYGFGMRHLSPLLPSLRSVAAGIVIATAPIAGAFAAAASETAITCTNPASGATWQIKVDYANSTVDTNAASISDSKISWHDGKENGNYTLDRKTGTLIFTGPSSTGGYFISDRCSLDNSG